MIKYYIAIEPSGDDLSRITEVMRQLGDVAPIPHITVKAPQGITPDLAWLPKVRNLAEGTSSFPVIFGESDTFDNRVLYLSVQSDGLAELHHRVLEIVVPSTDLIGRYGEDKPYIAHLTLAVARKKAALPPYRHLTSTLSDLEPFEARELVVFRREASEPYKAWLRLPFARREL